MSIILHTNSFGDTIYVCPYCSGIGIGCAICNGIGRVLKWNGTPALVPMPYGKILPDLTSCYYPNNEDDEPLLCPNCGSDHIVELSNDYNLWIFEYNIYPIDRWFCISCQDSWCYEREH